MTDAHAAKFTELRPLLFTISYEILGSATDADDALQESYLRWAEIDLATIADPKAYLARVVTRQSLNLARGASRRREQYVGPWLPEPLLIDDGNSPEADLLLTESVSMAMLLVLETLSPDERAVFVLREVFGFSHREVAEALDRSTDAVRQMAQRARGHVQARRPRHKPLDRARADELTLQFFGAAATGDLTKLMELLAPEVTYVSDSDGKVSAARRPVVGADRVARFIIGLIARGGPTVRAELTHYNGAPALVLHSGDLLEAVVTVEFTGELVSNLYTMRNPDKLGNVFSARRIAR